MYSTRVVLMVMIDADISVRALIALRSVNKKACYADDRPLPG